MIDNIARPHAITMTTVAGLNFFDAYSNLRYSIDAINFIINNLFLIL